MNYPVNENQRTIGNTSFADMIAQAQVVTDIDNSIAALTASLNTLGASSASETYRAIAKENSISAFITAEASRAGAAETGIKATVVVETARAKAAEVILTTAVTALQAAPSTSVQDITLTSWFFSDSFGSQYGRTDSSLNINIRCYRVGNQVTLTLAAGRTPGNGGLFAIYCAFLPSWARPVRDTCMPLMIWTYSNMSPGYLLLSSDTGEIRMQLISQVWEYSCGLIYDTCVTYII